MVYSFFSFECVRLNYADFIFTIIYFVQQKYSSFHSKKPPSPKKQRPPPPPQPQSSSSSPESTLHVDLDPDELIIEKLQYFISSIQAVMEYYLLVRKTNKKKRSVLLLFLISYRIQRI
jgi:hypothetical protein